jgi:hypothetical protein
VAATTAPGPTATAKSAAPSLTARTTQTITTLAGYAGADQATKDELANRRRAVARVRGFASDAPAVADRPVAPRATDGERGRRLGLPTVTRHPDDRGCHEQREETARRRIVRPRFFLWPQIRPQHPPKEVPPCRMPAKIANELPSASR